MELEEYARGSIPRLALSTLTEQADVPLGDYGSCRSVAEYGVSVLNHLSVMEALRPVNPDATASSAAV